MLIFVSSLTIICVMAKAMASADSRSFIAWPKGPCDPNFCQGKARDCVDILRRNPDAASGVYNVCIDRKYTNLGVYCDMETDGGGWMVFQRRASGAVDFYRDWESYARGFGKPKEEFWLGNRVLHAITDCNGPCDVRFDLQDFALAERYATYKNFYIDGEIEKFRLHIGEYEGDAGDSFSVHGTHAFSTKDRDHDILETNNCAEIYEGAWWYTKCHGSNLNGPYLAGKHESYADGIEWKTWHGYHYSLKKTEMKLRCSN